MWLFFQELQSKTLSTRYFETQKAGKELNLANSKQSSYSANSVVAFAQPRLLCMHCH